MADYSKNNFVIPASPQDTSLRIRDIRGQIRFTIYNNTETVFYNSENIVVIKTDDGDITTILLDFATKIEAIQALSILNSEYLTIRNNFLLKQRDDLIESIGIAISGDEKQIIFSDASTSGSIVDNQVDFSIPDAIIVNSVFINGISVSEFIFDKNSKILTLESIGYNIEASDEVLVLYH